MGCTSLAVLLWVALAVQTKRNNAIRARQQQGAAAGASMARLPACAVCVGGLTPHRRLPTCLLACSHPAPWPAAAASKHAAMALPVVVVQPDDSMDFGAKLYRTPSGGYRCAGRGLGQWLGQQLGHWLGQWAAAAALG